MDDIFNYPVLVYVTIEGLRVYWAHGLLQKSPKISPSLIVLLSEVLKFFCSLVAFQYNNGDFSALRKRVSIQGMKAVLFYLIPTTLYLLNNTIYINVLPFTSPSLLQACVLLKIPATAILHHFWVEKQRNVLVWSSLGWLTLGVFSFTLPAKDFIAVAAGTAIALSSSVASIGVETSTESLSELQLYLSFFGTILSAATYPLAQFWPRFPADSKVKAASSNHVFAVIVLVLLTASGGFLAAYIIRKKGNLTKTVVAVGIMLSIALCQYNSAVGITYEELPGWKGFAGILIIAAAFLYHKHNNDRVQECQYTSFVSEDSETIALEGSREKSEELREETDRSLEESEESQEKFEDPVDEEDPVVEEDPMDERPLKSEALPPTSRLAFFSSTISCGLLPDPTVEAWTPAIMTFCPSFLDFRSGSKEAAKSYPTTYLDGMRGMAALFVFFTHCTGEWYPWAFHGWDGDKNNYLIQLPWIRILINGNAMVSVFYVVSGFSISYRPLMLLRQGDIPKFNSTVASFLFRRHMRLFLPVIGVSFFAMLARYFNFFVGSDIKSPRTDIFFRQVEHWYWNIVSTANPFKMLYLDAVMAASTVYDMNLWTIPFEFRGSMVVFLVLILTAYIGTANRLAVVAALSAFCLYFLHWDLFLFITGLFIAEIHLICEEREHEEKLTIRPPPSRAVSWGKKILWSAYFIAAVGLLSTPVPTPGVWAWPQIWQWTPPQWMKKGTEFWVAVAAVQVVFIVDRAKFLRVLFTNRFARYQGRISFSLYIVHGTVLRTFGRHFVPGVVRTIGYSTDLDRDLGIAVGFVGVVVVVIYLADLSTRVFDESSVKFAKWVYGVFCETPSGVHNRRP